MANVKQIFDGWNSLVAAKIPMDLLFLSLFLKELSYNTISATDFCLFCQKELNLSFFKWRYVS
jgi:hypothetical protein